MPPANIKFAHGPDAQPYRITEPAGNATMLEVALSLPRLVGSGLLFAGLADSCMMGMLLARLPIPAAIRALTGTPA